MNNTMDRADIKYAYLIASEQPVLPVLDNI